MAKTRKPGEYSSKADQLIEEAVRAVEAREKKEKVKMSRLEDSELDDHDEATEDVVEKQRITGSIAKIDLQQFVEKEAYLRLAAELENFRKRAFKERSEAERLGKEKALRGFLEIFDNLERGLKQASEDTALSAGLQIVLSQAEMWLKSEGLERIPTVGHVFDPAIHEAVSQIESSDQMPGSIIDEVRRGYKWSDRLLRPASVVVVRASQEMKTTMALSNSNPAFPNGKSDF